MRSLLGFLSAAFPVLALAQSPVPPRQLKVAEGVYLFITAPHSDVGLEGNSIAIVGEDGVLIFDSNGTPAAAAAVLAEVRKLTSAPVRYLVYSHWHWDHWYGSETYRAAFPGLTVVAQEKTRQLMLGPALEFNRPGIETQLPQHIGTVEQQLARATGEQPGSAEADRLARHLREDREFLEQKRAVHHVAPDLTFRDSLTIWLGSRRVQVLHYDRGVTPGDALLYLPAEKVVITGDLLVNPISFALGSYPSGWIRNLEHIAALDAAVIIPGHGEPLHDKALLETTLALLRRLQQLGSEAKRRGLNVEAARAEAGKAVAALRARLTRGDAGLDQAFDVYMVDWFLHRVYEELDGPLTDAIAPIPRHGAPG